MRSILLLIGNNMKVLFRKRGNIVIYVFLPLLGVLLSLLLYGGSDNSALRVGVADHDNGMLSADLRAVMQNKNGFLVSDISENEVNDKLLDSDLDAAIVIPEDFTESVYSGGIRDIEVISLRGRSTTVWIEQLLNSHLDSLSGLSAAAGGDKAKFDKMYEQLKYNTIKMNVVELEDKLTGKYMTRTSIGFLIMFILFGASSTSTIILKEKRIHTFHRICSAPVNSSRYILANSLTSLIVVIIQILLIQLIMKFAIRFDTGVNDIALFAVLLMFGFDAVGIGLLVTAFSSSSYMAGNLSTLIITPTCMLGGCFWSIETMPEFMRKISYFMPQRWAIDAVEKLGTGAGRPGVYLNFTVLAAFAAAFILVATYKFSRTDNMQKFV